jgi:subfamily B ATP-binding cassette protein HlyB/CyaB
MFSSPLYLIQLLALGIPVFTQVVLEKVVVHLSQSTLVVIGIGMTLGGDHVCV